MEHPLTDNWFVLRDLTRPNAKRPAYRLLEEKGIEIFTPMRWRLVERKGKRIREEVPLLHDLLFAHTTCACMDPIVEEISTLQYRYLRGGYRKPMTVGHAEMNRFIRAVHSDDSPRYFLVEELTPAMYGRMIRIEGGPLDGYEGRLLSIRGSRVKRLIVEIPVCWSPLWRSILYIFDYYNIDPLYSTGTHWVAFERSVYQLLRLSPQNHRAISIS